MTLDSLLAATPKRDDLVVDGSGRFSSADVEHQVVMVAAGLRARGAGPGDRVAFRLPPGLDSVVAYRACWRIGAVAVALHPAAGLHQLARAMDQVRPTVAVAGPDCPKTRLPRTTTIDELSREGAAALAGSTGTRTPAAHPPHSTHPAEAVGPPSGTAVHRAVNTDDADAVVMFTSGSTGTPRGVVHTHGSLRYKVVQLTEAHGLTDQTTALWCRLRWPMSRDCCTAC